MAEAPAAPPKLGASDLVEIKLAECGADFCFRLLQDIVVPRPVFLIGTVSTYGVNNVAPFSYVSPAATIPPSFVLSVVRRDDGSEKDTLVNLRSSGELVINSVTEGILHSANACAEALPSDVSEFDFTGLTPSFFASRAPHVAQSPVRLECKVESETSLGSGTAGSASIVIVSVTRAYVTKAAYRGKGRIDVAMLRLIGRSSIDQYLVADGQFTVARPNTGEAVV